MSAWDVAAVLVEARERFKPSSRFFKKLKKRLMKPGSYDDAAALAAWIRREARADADRQRKEEERG